MKDQDLLRYSRQILLPEWGVEGQQNLSQAKVLMMGVGGLGSAAALYLTAAGVGYLRLVDFDTVELSNLQRQILHQTSRIGELKTTSAKSQLSDINANCYISTISHTLEYNALLKEATWADVVIDGTDNFNSRFTINKACYETQTPLVSGAAIRWDGQVAVFNQSKESACYQCLYPTQGNQDDTCVNNGVISPLVGIIGSIQALETMKIIANIGETLASRLLIFDALYMQWRTIKLNKDPQCPICQNKQ